MLHDRVKHVSCNFDQADLTDVRDLAEEVGVDPVALHAQAATITPARGLMEHLDKQDESQEPHPIQNEQGFCLGSNHGLRGI